MFSSFKTLALVAAATFLPAIVLAAPTSPASGVTSHAGSALLLQGCSCSSASQIITDLTVKVSTSLTELHCLTAQNATLATVKPLIAEITTAISASVVQVKALIGMDVEIIFASVDGTAQVTIYEIASLLAVLFVNVCGALGYVLTLVADVELVTLLCGVGESLAVLLNCVVEITAPTAVGLVASLLTQIGGFNSDIVRVFTNLNVVTLITLFRNC